MPAMKPQRSLRIIFAGTLIALMGACATAPTSGPAALVGTWTNTLGTVWTVNPTEHSRSTSTRTANLTCGVIMGLPRFLGPGGRDNLVQLGFHVERALVVKS